VTVNKKIIEDGSALCLAARIGPPNFIDALLRLGADVNHVMTSGQSRSARAFVNDLNVGLLIARGAKVNMHLVREIYGSALAGACAEGSIETIGILLDAGASINMPITSGHYGSALAAACHRSSEPKVKFLLSQGADVNMVLENGDFPSSLIAAILARNHQIVQTLLENGADPNLPIPRGRFGDAISLAISLTDRVSICTLIEAGARIGPLASDLINTGQLANTDNDHHAVTHASSSSRPIPSSYMFYCDLRELANECHDLSSWFFSARVLIRNRRTIGYSSVGQFLCETYGLLARKFPDNLVRAFESEARSYGEFILGQISHYAYCNSQMMGLCLSGYTSTKSS
jgi:ankyrin repeat protein